MKQIVSLVGYLEGFSFLILMGFAMPMKYIAGDPSWVSLMGSLNGFLFLASIGLLGLGI
jgi:integral membrane protein